MADTRPKNPIALENIKNMTNQQYMLLILVTTLKMGDPDLNTETVAQMQLTIHTASQIIAGRLKEQANKTGENPETLMDKLSEETENLLESHPEILENMLKDEQKSPK